MHTFCANVTVRLLAAVVLLFVWLTACERVQRPNRRISETAHKPATSARPRIIFGDALVPGKMLSYVQPEYPMWARRKHLEGTVQLRATIGKDGRPRDLVFVNGPKQLAPYAEAAVRKWRYKPVVLNAVPVEVKTDILVPFILPR